ncbi:hypothetical protein HK096_002906, partial [Nowakowskiella sp. JEL0078]
SKGKELKKTVKFEEADLEFAKFKAKISTKLNLKQTLFEIHCTVPNDESITVLSEDDDIREVLELKMKLLIVPNTYEKVTNESFANSTITVVVYSSATVKKNYQLFITSEELSYSAFTTMIANVLDDIPANMDFSYFDVATNREFELHKLSIIAEIVYKKFDFW